jgi:phosphatidylglycerophosphate synthase
VHCGPAASRAKVFPEHAPERRARKTRALNFESNEIIQEGNMATTGPKTMTEFCEQVNPRILLEMRRARSLAEMPNDEPNEMRRVQDSWAAAAETRALVWMAARTPASISPDHLTALGLAAQIGAGACYALASNLNQPRNRFWLLGVIACLALNWLGDSLDGTLARVRQRLRPRYGFYVDHMVDTFGALALMGGLALSGYMHPWIATGLLVAFLMLSIQTYLASYALGEFRLSFWRFGPTELRILLAVGNLALLWKPVIHFLGGKYRLFDVGGAIGLAGMGLMLVVFTIENTVRLYREERITQ